MTVPGLEDVDSNDPSGSVYVLEHVNVLLEHFRYLLNSLHYIKGYETVLNNVKQDYLLTFWLYEQDLKDSNLDILGDLKRIEAAIKRFPHDGIKYPFAGPKLSLDHLGLIIKEEKGTFFSKRIRDSREYQADANVFGFIFPLIDDEDVDKLLDGHLAMVLGMFRQNIILEEDLNSSILPFTVNGDDLPWEIEKVGYNVKYTEDSKTFSDMVADGRRIREGGYNDDDLMDFGSLSLSDTNLTVDS